MSGIENRTRDKVCMRMFYLGNAIPGHPEWGGKECEAETEGGTLLHWTKLQKKTQLLLGQIGCLQIGFREPLYTEAIHCRKEGKWIYTWFLPALWLSLVKSLPHFCCVNWPLWTADGNSYSMLCSTEFLFGSAKTGFGIGAAVAAAILSMMEAMPAPVSPLEEGEFQQCEGERQWGR